MVRQCCEMRGGKSFCLISVYYLLLHNGPKARPVRTTHRVAISGVIYTSQTTLGIRHVCVPKKVPLTAQLECSKIHKQYDCSWKYEDGSMLADGWVSK